MNSEKGKLKEILGVSWFNLLVKEFEKSYMKDLSIFLNSEVKEGKEVYPKGNEMFLSLNLTPYDEVKVVIIGQDPYHGPGQAHGLSFSVPEGVKIPPSLHNIFLELKEDLNISIPQNGFLSNWAQQGVLLLNSVLSVERGKPGSHSLKGWEKFTDKIIALLNNKEHIVFMLWGNYAALKGREIDASKHLVLKSAHPSPLSSHKGFFGNKHFSKCNKFLDTKGIEPIDWQI